MKDKNKISLALGITCFALTLGIGIQLNTTSDIDSEVSQNYELNNLRSEVLKYKERYESKYSELEEAERKLEEERTNSTQNNSQLTELETEIKEGNKLIGLTEVTGDGVVITLSDSKIDVSQVLEPSALIVHDLDILSVVNELINAGAEAISINDQRIIFDTGITCGGNIIDINGNKVGAPFVIKAIGLPEQLAAIERPGGYLDNLEARSIEVDFQKSDNVTIGKYTGVITFDYLEVLE